MSKLFKVVEYIEKVLQPSLIEEGDNSGLLVGDRMQEIKHIRVALEATEAVIDSAITDEVDLLIVHHPMIYRSIRCVTSDTIEGRKIMKLVKNGISLYAAHSNFDKCEGGLNRAFGQLSGLIDIEKVDSDDTGYLLKGLLKEEKTLKEYVKELGEVLSAPSLNYVGSDEESIRSVGFCTGSGMSLISDGLFEEVDVYLTGDLKYHEAMWVYESGYKVIDITHFYSEIIAIDVLNDLLTDVIPSDTYISKDKVLTCPIKGGI